VKVAVVGNCSVCPRPSHACPESQFGIQPGPKCPLEDVSDDGLEDVIDMLETSVTIGNLNPGNGPLELLLKIRKVLHEK
jgi:hypothetical protein